MPGSPLSTGAASRHRVGRLPRSAGVTALDGALTAALERAREGDEAAFGRVFRAVQPGLLRYLAALVGAEAEDVASETWSQVCRDLDRFRGDIDGFRGWVATIARHRALDHLRAASRRPADPVDVLPERAGPADTEDGALESLSTDAALALIASLPRDQAEAVLLRTVMGLDARTAGQVLGKRAGAVRAAAFRGLRTLAEAVDPGDRPAAHNTFHTSGADEVR